MYINYAWCIIAYFFLLISILSNTSTYELFITPLLLLQLMTIATMVMIISV